MRLKRSPRNRRQTRKRTTNSGRAASEPPPYLSNQTEYVFSYTTKKNVIYYSQSELFRRVLDAERPETYIAYAKRGLRLL